MRYISLFSGVEAATLAFKPLGWRPVCFAEIDDFPKAVLNHHYPYVQNVGDVTKVDWTKYKGEADLVVGGSPCFPAGSLVLRNDGFVPIERIKPGDKVITHKGRLRTVLSVGEKQSDTILLKGAGSVGIECTSNHPFYSTHKINKRSSKNHGYIRVPSGEFQWSPASDMLGKFWMNVCEIDKEDIPGLSQPSKGKRGFGYLSDIKFDENFFYFVGQWLGNGWATEYKRKDRVDSHTKRVFLCCSKDKRDYLNEKLDKTGLHFICTEEKTTYRFTLSSTQLYDWIAGNFGVRAEDKRIPTWVFGMEKHLRKAIFDGYIESEGCLYKGIFKSSSINYGLLLGIKTIAGSLGYTSSVSVTKQRKDSTMEDWSVRSRPCYRQTYYPVTKSSFFADKGWFGKVRKLEECGKNVTVYNLEVDEDHSYTVDGIAVHNCQSFSLAGKRDGLKGESRLMYEYIRAVREVRPRWMLWENVPGALSSDDGEAFRQLLSELDDIGYGLAWRVLDAQFFGVAQRRRRIFLVGHLGEEPPIEVLFEPDRLSWDYSSSRKKRQELAEVAGRHAYHAGFKYHNGSKSRGIGEEYEQSPTLTADCHCPAVYPTNEQVATRWNKVDDRTALGIGDDGDPGFTIMANHPHMVADCREAYGFLNPEGTQSKRIFAPGSCSPALSSGDGEGTDIQPSVLAFAQNSQDEVRIQGDGTISGALSAHPGMKQTTYICMVDTQANSSVDMDNCGTITAHSAKSSPVVCGNHQRNMVARRLTPLECERLQGFPDDYTKIPYKGKTADECPDSHRYKAIGNSMAVPVMRWIGERMQKADERYIISDDVSANRKGLLSKMRKM